MREIIISLRLLGSYLNRPYNRQTISAISVLTQGPSFQRRKYQSVSLLNLSVSGSRKSHLYKFASVPTLALRLDVKLTSMYVLRHLQ